MLIAHAALQRIFCYQIRKAQLHSVKKPCRLLDSDKQWNCMGYEWQGFGSWGSTVTPVRSCSKLSPCPTQPLPAAFQDGPITHQGQAHHLSVFVLLG